MAVTYLPKKQGANPLGILSALASVAFPAAAPWLAGANMLKSGIEGDWAGVAKNGVTAFTGGKAPTGDTSAAMPEITSNMNNPAFMSNELSNLNVASQVPMTPWQEYQSTVGTNGWQQPNYFKQKGWRG